jgi:hypothetical protein
MLGMRGPWGSLWSLFLFLFLALWVIGLYINPIGPVYWGISWVPIIFAGILFAILFIAIAPTVNDSTTLRDKQGKVIEPDSMDTRMKTREHAYAATGSFFWVLMALFVMAIIFGVTFKAF